MNIFSLEGSKVKEIKLPNQFKEKVRLDLIKRAVIVIQSNKRQKYGAKPNAGMRASAKVSRRRRKYRGAYGRGISRVPRKVMLKRGTNIIFTAAFAPGIVSGRRAHPPKAEKEWSKKINIKERRKAIRSALAATVDKKLVKERGHFFKEYPLIVDSKIESLKKTKDVKSVLLKLGLGKELERISKKKVRSSKEMSRGRKYKIKKGPLIVTSKDCDLMKSAGNLQGFDVVKVDLVNAELLAPGTHPGRLTIYTDKSIERMEKERLFFDKEKK